MGVNSAFAICGIANWYHVIFLQKHITLISSGAGRNALCVYTESQAFMMKISTAYHEAPTTKFGLFWDVDNWNFSNIKTYDAFGPSYFRWVYSLFTTFIKLV